MAPVHELDEQAIAAIAHALPAQDAATALHATLTALYGPQTPPDTLPSFDPAHLALIANGAAPPPPALVVLKALAVGASATADACACASVLAGHTSESDDYGDLAVFLGPGQFGKGHEQRILASLGLQTWAGLETRPLELNPTVPLPRTIPEGEVSDSLKAVLSILADDHGFLVINGSKVLHVLVGRDSDDWLGLLGLAVWSDF